MRRPLPLSRRLALLTELEANVRCQHCDARLRRTAAGVSAAVMAFAPGVAAICALAFDSYRYQCSGRGTAQPIIPPARAL